jgi:hypothetical protein
MLSRSTLRLLLGSIAKKCEELSQIVNISKDDVMSIKTMETANDRSPCNNWERCKVVFDLFLGHKSKNGIIEGNAPFSREQLTNSF